MYPEIFKIGPFTVYSYGLMLGVSFIVASFILSAEFKRVKLKDTFASEITLISIILGVTGSKLFHMIENWSAFLENPGMIISPGGLTYYGGFILVALGLAFYTKRKKLKFLMIMDLAAPSLAIAYGIGRIGCHLAGDGDYGIPTTLPWGMSYANGIVKPVEMFAGSKYAAQYSNGIFPNTTPLHPTPLYEFFIAVIIFFILWQVRKKFITHGKLFMLYLILSGIARLLVEFLRLNPEFLFGLTQAQIISLVLIIVGAIGLYRLGEPVKHSKELK